MTAPAGVSRQIRRRIQKQIRKSGLSVSADRAVKDVSMTVTVHRTKWFDFRLQVGARLMRLGAKIIGYGRFTLDVENAARE